jgi:hypothetical protein
MLGFEDPRSTSSAAQMLLFFLSRWLLAAPVTAPSPHEEKAASGHPKKWAGLREFADGRACSSRRRPLGVELHLGILNVLDELREFFLAVALLQRGCRPE